MGSNKVNYLVNYHNFWVHNHFFKNVLWFQKHFQAQDTDIIVASLPKCGTTWLKALVYSIVNRSHHPTKQSPLLTHHPHDLVYRLESGIYGDHFRHLRPSTLHELPSPRLFNTHVPCTILPESIKSSRCRILFISRNPLDACVSQWHFYTKLAKKLAGDKHNEIQPYSIQDYFEDFVAGKIIYGPFFEHVVEYWKLSIEQPDKVLFLKYEDLKEDPTHELKRVAKFVGMPFSLEEENGGVIKDIIELCSIKTLKDLDVNKNEARVNNRLMENQDFFRKGEVGDWTNYFTPAMVERMNILMQQKLEGTG